MVVKRFRHMSNLFSGQLLTKNNFLPYPNLLPLVAFYYMKEEKLRHRFCYMWKLG
ncbi:unnamed protein product [Coffea canephora]|uniref:DH200=94 genomic scaffold, scaffold_4032 n=1 Tax=Coffea canephora TaxID=49390 RepID=A0A068VL46_COFCA|nr:unnamed protein product [Coffea canephora]